VARELPEGTRARLMEKLGVHDRLELLKYAIRRGIISVDT
jgi:DNA-binding NarL/FixJ family response regulator